MRGGVCRLGSRETSILCPDCPPKFLSYRLGIVGKGLLGNPPKSGRGVVFSVTERPSSDSFFLDFFLLFFPGAVRRCGSSSSGSLNFLFCEIEVSRIKQDTKKPFVASSPGEHRIRDAACSGDESFQDAGQERIWVNAAYSDHPTPQAILGEAIQGGLHLDQRGRILGISLHRS